MSAASAAARVRDALSAVPRQRAYVALGGNLGDVPAAVQSALAAMAQLPGTRLEEVSSLYQTRPVDASGPDFFNAVVALQSALGPHELLRALLEQELLHERERPYRNAPRTLDLDLLWYGGLQIESASLCLPHPRLGQRAFVLEPLAEVMAQCMANHAARALTRRDAGTSSLPGGPTLPDEATRVRLAKEQGIFRFGTLVAPRPAN